MEQRWTERIPMAVDVMVNYPSLGLVRGKSKDISLDGMFVETGAIALAADNPLSVTFVLPQDKSNQQYELRAQVVYSCSRGAALVFRGLDVSVISQLRKSLYSY